jgi:hypothetical protein
MSRLRRAERRAAALERPQAQLHAADPRQALIERLMAVKHVQGDLPPLSAEESEKVKADMVKWLRGRGYGI